MKKKKFSLLVYIALLIAFFLMLIFYHKNYYYNILLQICCYFVAVAGLNFITGMTGQPMLGMAGVFAIGAYTTSILTTKCGFTAIQAVPAVLLMGLLVGVLLGYPSLRLSGVYLSFTTIAFSEIVRILLTNMTELTGGGTGLKNIPNYVLFDVELNSLKSKAVFYVFIAILVALFSSRVIRSKWGRSFFAVKDNIEAVPTCSMNVTNIKLLAFCLATIFGSLGGSMYAHLFNYVNPTSYNQKLSVTMLSMLIVGGMGSIQGCLIGTIIVVLIPECLRFLGKYYDIIYSFLILMYIVLLPGGIVNLKNKDIDRKTKLLELVRIFSGR